MCNAAPEKEGHGALRATPDGPEVRCGPAGWSYADWQGVVYAAGTRGGRQNLELLLALFPTIEVNVTFYRDVGATQIAAWCRRTEAYPDFRWCFKLSQRLSHGGGVPDPAAVNAACAAFWPARESGHLGALLLQFPWSLRPTPATRAALADVASAARDAGWPLVIEVRRAGWVAPLPFPAVVPDQPSSRGNLDPGDALAAAVLQAGPASPLYFRLHGRNAAAWFDPGAGRDQRYDYLYSDAQLAGWADRLRATAPGLPAGTPVYVIANNHFRGQAVVNALQLQRLWSGRTPAVPASLRRVFPRELAAFPATEPAAGHGEPPLF